MVAHPFAAGPVPFVGRLEELAAVHQWYEDAAGGTPRVVLVEGGAGLGKTRLATRLEEEASRAGALVLTGAAPPQVQVPYLAVLSALLPVLEGSDHPAAARLRSLIDDPGDDPGDARFSTRELALYLAVSELVIAMGTQRPLVLVVDDFHWADGPTVELVLHMAAALAQAGARAPTRVMLVLTARPGAATSPVGRALARLRHEDHVRRLVLSGLSELEVNDFLVALGPGRPTPRLLDPLRRLTEGNPLLLRTLWLRLLDEGTITLDGTVVVPRRDDVDLVPGFVDLDEELRAQVDAAPLELRRLLDATAINGTAAPVHLVAAMVDEPPEHVVDVVRSHQSLGLAELRQGRVAFLHPQTAVLVLGELDASARSQMHARVVEAATAANPDGEIALDLIDHLLGSAELIEAARRVELLISAGRRAMGLGAWAPAAAAFEAAVETLDEPDGRLDQVEWAAALAHFRNHDRRGAERHARALVERARAASDLATWGEALELLTRVQLTVGPDIVGRRLDATAIEEFLGAAGAREPKLRARLTGALAELHFGAFDFDAGLTCSDAARRIAAEVGDDELTAVTEFVEGIQRLGRLQLAEAEACFTTSRAHADRLADPWLRTWGRGRLPLVRWAQGRFAEAWAAVHDALEVAEANHDWAELSIVHAAATGLATAEGRFETAELHAADASRAFIRSEYAYTPGVLFPALAMARSLRGDRDGAAAALARWRTHGAGGLSGTFELFVAAAVGDVEATRVLLDRHPWRPGKHRPVDLATLAFASGYVDVADLLGEPALSDAVMPALEEAHRRGVRFLLAGGPSSLSRVLATAHRLRGDDARARERLEDAARDLEAAPSRLGEAQLSYERSLYAALEGDAASAASSAADAAAAFDDIGAFVGLGRAEAVRRRVTRGTVQPARRTRVILVTDLVGSTPLNVAVGDDRYLELLQEHDRTITDLVRRHAGVPINHTGDGLLAWFDRADDAAACALAFQPTLDDLNRAHPEHPLLVRCGLAAGEPIDEAGNIFGLAVVRATRVCGEGDAGDVLAAPEVMALAPTIHSELRGPVALKGLPEPVLLHSLRPANSQR